MPFSCCELSLPEHWLPHLEAQSQALCLSACSLCVRPLPVLSSEPPGPDLPKGGSQIPSAKSCPPEPHLVPVDDV
jgi:hypothetical protein